jgi:hypothetical protein
MDLPARFLPTEERHFTSCICATLSSYPHITDLKAKHM